MQVFVLGMHRSGTSAVTRLINLMGAYFGPERLSLGASAQNPTGFWERRDVLDENDAVLRSADADWWKVADFSVDKVASDARERFDRNVATIVDGLNAHRPWVVKDPRLCLLFPMWRCHVSSPVCVLVHRPPIQVAHSLERRNGFPQPFGIALWERYVLDALAGSAGLPRVLVSYEQLMADPVGQVDRLLRKLTDAGVEGLDRPSEADIESFVTPDFFHHRQPEDEQAGVLNEAQYELARAMTTGAALDLEEIPQLSQQARDILRLYEELSASRDDITSARAEMRKLSSAIESVQQENERLARDLAMLAESGKADVRDLETLREDLAGTLLDRNGLHKRLAKEQQENQAGREEVDQLRGDLDAAAAEIAALTEQSRSLQQALTEAHAEREELRGRLDEVGTDLERVRSEHAATKSERRRAVAEVEDLKAQVARLNQIEQARALESDRAAKLETAVRRLEDQLEVWRARSATAQARQREFERMTEELLVFLKRAHRNFQQLVADGRWRLGPIEVWSRGQRDAMDASLAKLFREVGGWVRRHRDELVRIAGRDQPSSLTPGRSAEGTVSEPPGCLDPSSAPAILVSDSGPRVHHRTGPESVAATSGRRRGVVYTAVAGGSDQLKLPHVVPESFEFVCFTDGDIDNHTVWQLRRFDYFNVDPARMVCFFKLHPHIYFSDFDVSLWIDSNLVLKGDPEALAELVTDGAIAAFVHPQRGCIYDEAAEMVRRGGLDAAAVIESQMARYRKRGFPEGYGLMETNVLVRRHNDQAIKDLMTAWWAEIVNGSRRDQLSFNYALWKTGSTVRPIAPKGISVRDDPRFERFLRGPESTYQAPPLNEEHLGRIRELTGPQDAFGRNLQSGHVGVAGGPGIDVLGLDVIICVHDCLDEVRRCLRSVASSLARHHRVIIVDDASGEETARFLRLTAATDDRVTLIRRDVQVGYTKAANIGIRSSTSDFVILLNSDTLVPRNWWRKLAAVAFSSPSTGIVGPLSNAASWQSVPDILDSDGRLAVNRIPPGLTVDEMDEVAASCSPWTGPRVALANGFCLGVKRAVFEKVGLFDEGSFPEGYGEECDFCFRAEEAGFGIVIATNCYVYHQKSSSYTAARRDLLANKSSIALGKKYASSRIANAVESCKANPMLAAMRQRFSDLYRRPQMTLDNDRDRSEAPYHQPSEAVVLGAAVEESTRKTIQGPLVFPDLRVDVVVAVHNALDDVRRCLDSIVRNTEEDVHLVLVNDGSDSKTSGFLRDFSKRHETRCTLLVNETVQGYTYAANRGLRETSGDYVVLLNSDTIVPKGWLEPILACGESDPRIGILGPLSNAASYQSIPDVRLPSMDWALNELPRDYSVDDMAELVRQVSERRFPRVPFINGFCYVIKRQVVDAVGLFDEENFGRGYAEENDYSARAAKAGFSLVIVDDAYVYHAQSKSYSNDRRRKLSRASRESLDRIHGADFVLEGIRRTEEGSALLDGMRKRLADFLQNPDYTFKSIRVLWLLMNQGGSGGAHCIVQEAAGMNMLPDVRSEVAVRCELADRALSLYPEVPSETFFFFENETQLIEHACTFDVVVATHFLTFSTLERIYRTPGAAIQPAYYIQDYEPLFIPPNRPELVKQAESTYTASPSVLCFAKTEWLRTTLREKHGIQLSKVTPSLDTSIYRPKSRAKDATGPVHITAMVRPTTPRRAPEETMQLLKTIKERHGEGVRITVFGNDPQSGLFRRLPRDFDFENRGILKRAEVADLLSEADVFVDISHYQAFGLTAAEAMAVGCAVIAPRAGGATEFAVDGENALIVDSEKMEECIAALDRLITDGSLRRRLARAAVNISSRFNVRAAAWSEIDLMRDEVRKRTISIVVPVYGALDEALVCLESVVRNTHGPYRLIVIDDCSPDPGVWPALRQFVERHQQTVVRNDRNLGYTATVNNGCRMAEGDVVLLNSDTRVTDGWLDRLRSTAYSRERVATVTPLSNAAGAFSFPENNTLNAIPTGMTPDQIAQLVAMESPRLRPAVPTGNGYCMFIRREALDEIGDFDEAAFPNGYGEENDFCQRAIVAGFVNLIDDATYIYHHRTASFKQRKDAIVSESMRLINQRWPDYGRSVQHWLNDDPLNPFRDRVQGIIEDSQRAGARLWVTKAGEPPNMLHVIHMGSWGTWLTSRDLLTQIGRHYNCHLLVTGKDNWVLYTVRGDEYVQLRDYRFTNGWQIDAPLRGERLQALHDVRQRTRPDMVHVRHLLANHPDIVRVFKYTDTPAVISLHDYYTVCPAFNLIDDEKRYCAGVCSATPGECQTSPSWISEIPPLKNKYVWRWRDVVAPALALCEAIIVTSPTTQRVVQSHYPHLPDQKFHLIEHGRDLTRFEWVSEPPQPDRPVRLVIFGALGANKGLTLVGEMLKMSSREGVSIHVDILGTAVLPFDPGTLENCTYHGPYERHELPGLLANLRPSLALIPSICPETFCHALTESWAAGLPVLGSNLGAVGDRIARLGGGWALDPHDPIAWLEKIGEIVRSPEEYERRREEIRAHPRRTVADMAQDYFRLYRWVACLNGSELTPMAAGVSHGGESSASSRSV